MRYFILITSILLSAACTNQSEKKLIEDTTLGIIDASVKSEETNLKTKAEFNSIQPGDAGKLERSFENAPPLIPHTVNGFLPIKMNNNICLSCHLPNLAVDVGAVPLSATHFTDLRPKMVEKDGVMQFEDEEKIHIQDLNKPNHAYFNCTQCHVSQTDVSVDIENLFTPEFREKYGLKKSSLKSKLEEGI